MEKGPDPIQHLEHYMVNKIWLLETYNTLGQAEDIVIDRLGVYLKTTKAYVTSG